MRNKYYLFSLIISFFLGSNVDLFASKDLIISKDFTIFTSKNMQGYLKPLFTTLEEGFNTNLYTTAFYEKEWSIGLDISGMGVYIPDDQKNFNAERPQGYGNPDVTRTVEIRYGQQLINSTGQNRQPTIYGGLSVPIFSVPQSPKRQTYKYNNVAYYDSTIKSVAYVEGNRINVMAAVPNIQLCIGIPTQTQLRFRFLAAPIQGELLSYFSVIANQRIDDFFDLFNPHDKIGWALDGSFHRISRDAGIDINAWSFGSHVSKDFGQGFTGFIGLMYEDMKGSFKAIKDTTDASRRVQSPYPEVQFSAPLEFAIESFSKFRFVTGVTYLYKSIEIHADAAYASQPVVSLGLTVWFGRWGKLEEKNDIKIEKIEKIIDPMEIKK